MIPSFEKIFEVRDFFVHFYQKILGNELYFRYSFHKVTSLSPNQSSSSKWGLMVIERIEEDTKNKKICEKDGEEECSPLCDETCILAEAPEENHSCTIHQREETQLGPILVSFEGARLFEYIQISDTSYLLKYESNHLHVEWNESSGKWEFQQQINSFEALRAFFLSNHVSSHVGLFTTMLTTHMRVEFDFKMKKQPNLVMFFIYQPWFANSFYVFLSKTQYLTFQKKQEEEEEEGVACLV